MTSAEILRIRLRAAPAEPAPRAAPVAAPPVIGLEYLIEAAGGEQAVVRAAARRHSRPFRQANPVEVSETLALTLADRAPQAVRQLGNDAWATLQEAARQLALKVTAPSG